jgi:hypothetical protein
MQGGVETTIVIVCVGGRQTYEVYFLMEKSLRRYGLHNIKRQMACFLFFMQSTRVQVPNKKVSCPELSLKV